MNTILDAFTFGLEIGINTGIILVFFANALAGIKNAMFDIIQGEPNNQTKEDYIK